MSNCEAFAALNLGFRGTPGKNAKIEDGRKFILAGHLGLASSSKSMCKLSLAAALPLARVQAWFQAFRFINKDTIATMVNSALEASRQLPQASLEHPNTQEFLETPLSKWFLSCGEVFFVKFSEEEGLEHDWVEPSHMDGGASVLHLGLTLFGRRSIHCEQGGSLPEIVVDNCPGTVYLGGLTGPLHRVEHERPAEGELLDLGSSGQAAVAIMARCALFSFCRSRGKRGSPVPADFFEVLTKAFAEGLERPWRLPTLAECAPFLQEPELSEQTPELSEKSAERCLKRRRSEA